MRLNFKILLMLVAYVLNFVHDIQPHEHTQHNHIVSSESINHDLSQYLAPANEDIHQESSNHAKHTHELPFKHGHLLQAHDIIQHRSSQPTNYLTEFIIITVLDFPLQIPEPPPKEYFPKLESLYLSSIADSLIGMRAPPILS